MSDLPNGTYNIQSMEFNVVLGTTARTAHIDSSVETEAAAADTEEAAKGLPRQLAVVQAGAMPPTFIITQRESDGLYEIKLDGRICFHLNGQVAAQQGQKFGWTLIPRPDIGTTVYNIATGPKQWFLSSGDAYTLVEARIPTQPKTASTTSEQDVAAEASSDDKAAQYLWFFSPA